MGLTGQMHGLVLLDEKMNVLRPAILWNDQRTGAECEEIHRRYGKEAFIQETGNVALTGFTAPKILWVRNNEPEVYARARHVLLPKDYVRLRLTGVPAMDKADGAGTVLFNLKERNWSKSVLEKLEIPAEWLPPTFEGPEVTGTITAEAAKETGLAVGTPVMAGGGDQAAGAVGAGAVTPGVVSLTLGTVGRHLRQHRQAADRAPGATPRLLSRRARHLALHGSDAGGGGEHAVVPRRALPGRGASRRSTERPKGPRRGARGCCSCPYLSGERTPVPRSAGAGRLRGPDAAAPAGAPHAGRARGCGVQHEGLPRAC